MKIIRTIAVLAALSAAQGCSTTSLTGGDPSDRPVDKELVAALGGGLIGTLSINDMANGDRKRALEAEYRALEYSKSGDPINWQNGWTGNRGVVVAAQPYRVGTQDCRPYSHTINLSGNSETARGTACRNADGSWTPLL